LRFDNADSRFVRFDEDSLLPDATASAWDTRWFALAIYMPQDPDFRVLQISDTVPPPDM
jgi:hypothetical protein